MSISKASTIATSPLLPPVGKNGQRMERTKLTRSNLGRVCMQLQPCDHRRGCLHITKSSSMPLSPIDRRRPTMHSYQMQSTPNVRCGAASAEQTQTVTQKAPTITNIPGKEKSLKLDDGGFGFPPYHDGFGGGGGGGGGGNTSGCLSSAQTFVNPLALIQRNGVVGL